MFKVWIIVQEWKDLGESDRIVGVYSTEKLAEEKLQQIEKDYTEYSFHIEEEEVNE